MELKLTPKEILFMAKTPEGKWVIGLPIGMEENTFSGYTAMNVCDDTGYWGIKPIVPETLCQYTGVKDFYKKRIFGGHIVFTPNFGYKVVTWGSDAFEGLFEDMAAFMLNDTIAFLSGSEEAEIAGHILDNPEILERNKTREEERHDDY